jgi:sulfur-carrier protein
MRYRRGAGIRRAEVMTAGVTTVAHVTLIGPLKTAAGQAATFEVEAETIRQLLRAVAQRFPDLALLLDEGVAVAIDGEIHQDDWLAPIAPDSEVQILPPIAGG